MADNFFCELRDKKLIAINDMPIGPAMISTVEYNMGIITLELTTEGSDFLISFKAADATIKVE